MNSLLAILWLVLITTVAVHLVEAKGKGKARKEESEEQQGGESGEYVSQEDKSSRDFKTASSLSTVDGRRTDIQRSGVRRADLPRGGVRRWPYYLFREPYSDEIGSHEDDSFADEEARRSYRDHRRRYRSHRHDHGDENADVDLGVIGERRGSRTHGGRRRHSRRPSYSHQEESTYGSQDEMKGSDTEDSKVKSKSKKTTTVTTESDD